MEDLITTLSVLECELHTPATRHDHRRLTDLLHPDFLEFGRSGNTYTRADILDRLPAETDHETVHAQDFDAYPLADDIVLLTYKSAHVSADGQLEHHTLRSSLWKRSRSKWQMVFHQGTATTAFEPNTP